MERKNQTNPGYFRMIANSAKPVKGVGLFAINFRGRIVKKIKPDITYSETKEIGIDTVAFKFIPYNVNIKIKGEMYSFTSFDSIPKSYWKCVGPCRKHEDCRQHSDVCMCCDKRLRECL